MYYQNASLCFCIKNIKNKIYIYQNVFIIQGIKYKIFYFKITVKLLIYL